MPMQKGQVFMANFPVEAAGLTCRAGVVSPKQREGLCFAAVLPSAEGQSSDDETDPEMPRLHESDSSGNERPVQDLRQVNAAGLQAGIADASESDRSNGERLFWAALGPSLLPLGSPWPPRGSSCGLPLIPLGSPGRPLGWAWAEVRFGVKSGGSKVRSVKHYGTF